MQKKYGTVFWRNLCVDFLIVLVFALMLWPLTNEVNRTVRRQELNERRAVLTNAMDELAQELYFLRTLLFQARSNEYFSRLSIIANGLMPSDYIAIGNAHKYIATIAGANPMVADILVILHGPGIVITKGTSYHSFDEFRRLYAIAGADVDALLTPRSFAGRRRFDYGPACQAYSVSSGAANAAFLCNLPLLTDGKGMATLLIRKDALRASFLSEHLREYASFSLTDMDDNVLFTYSPPGEALPSAMQSGYESLIIENADSALKLRFWLPERYFSDTLTGVRSTLIGLISLAFSIAVLAAVYFAWRQSQPMRKLLGAFADQHLLTPERRNEYEWIKNSVLTMQAEHADVLMQLGNYQSTLRSLATERLLNQGALTREQLKKTQAILADFPPQYVIGYALLEAEALAPEQDEVRAMLTLRTLRDALPKNTIVHVLSAAEFALIIPFTGERTMPETLLNMLETGGALPRLRACFSDPSSGLLHVNAAFEQARLRAVLKENEQMEDSGADLSQKNLQILYQCLLAGEEASVVKVLDSLLFRGDGPQTDMEQRYYGIRMQLLLAAQETDTSLSVEKYHAAQRPEKLKENLLAAVSAICSNVLRRQESQNSRRREEMLAYVREHYGDETLCPAQLADFFHVSERYIFTFFKENTGFSPASYIQQVRMEQAAQMLRTTTLTAQKVGELCGFTNFSTYYKAFKRAFGVTPSMYRENANAKKDEAK